MRPILVFDVNETLLDLRHLDPYFERAFGSASARREWFAYLLRTSFLTVILGNYSDFARLGRIALEAIEAIRGVTLSEDQRTELLAAVREMPPHEDVKDGLEKLKESGFRLAALTNSSPSMAQAQLTNAGLLAYFELVLSVDAVRRFKPAPEVYRMAAERLGASTSDVIMIAAHSWDIAGAMNAGCEGAFVARPGQVIDGITPKPRFIAPDLRALADQLIRAFAAAPD